LSIECGSDQHASVQRVAYVFFAIWPVGMPLLYLLMLVTCRGALVEKRSTPLTHATSFLHQEYSSHFFWWEYVTAIRTGAGCLSRVVPLLSPVFESRLPGHSSCSSVSWSRASS
jgi:hypothetical protein